MQLKAVKPACRALPACRRLGKDFMTSNPAVMADSDGSRIDKGNPAATFAAVQRISPQHNHHTPHQAHEPAVADCCWKLSSQVLQDILLIVCLESSIATLMKMDKNGHDFTHT